MRKYEVPEKWSKYLKAAEIKKHTEELFQAADLEIRGDSLGFQLYRDWKATEALRKREKKEVFKT